jgi:LCP family protein required for cell wall assembly
VAARVRSTRRIALALSLVTVWVVGSTVGTTSGPTSARAMPLFQIEPAHAEHVPVLDGSEPIFVLLIGSDARPGEAVGEVRADSIHVVAINPAEAKMTIVGFPRDALVPIPGFGTTKINAAMVSGGPELVLETVEDLTGITMDYWALTGFRGFDAMISQVGGLTMDVPFSLIDSAAGANLQAGRQTLTGDDALAFARARKSLPSGDFGRSENQGRLMVAALAEFQKQFRSDPSRLLVWVAAGLRNASSDVPLDQLMSLAFTATTLNARRVTNVVLPGSVGMNGTTSVVNLNQTALQAISRDLENDGLVKRSNVPPSPNADLLP